MNFGFVWLFAALFIALFEFVSIGSFFCLASAIGCLFAAFAALFFDEFLIQFFSFVLTTFFSFSFFASLIKSRHLSKERSPAGATNVDALIGQTGRVIKEISFDKPGLVKVGGEVWSASLALSHQGTLLSSSDELVKIVGVQGCRLIVTVQSRMETED